MRRLRNMRWRVPGRSHLRGRHLLHRRRQVHRLRNLRKRLSYRRHRGSLNVSTMTGCPSGQLFLCPDAVLHTCMSAAAVPGLLLQDDGQGIGLRPGLSRPGRPARGRRAGDDNLSCHLSCRSPAGLLQDRAKPMPNAARAASGPAACPVSLEVWCILSPAVGSRSSLLLHSCVA